MNNALYIQLSCKLQKSSFAVLCYIALSHQSRQRTCEANQAGENSSFIFTVCVKSVPRYHFKLANVVLQMAAK